MTRLKKVAEFKDFNKFDKVLDKRVIKIGRFGGLKVSLNVTVEGKKCIISVSRNQLAKLALSLAKANKDDEDIVQNFILLKAKLSSLETHRTPGHLSKRLGNFIFKLFHFGRDRITLLRRKEVFLKLNETSSDSRTSTEDSSESTEEVKPRAKRRSTSSEIPVSAKFTKPKAQASSEASESDEWEPPEDPTAPVNLEKWMRWLAKHHPEAFK